jgi:hypothetical protein
METAYGDAAASFSADDLLAVIAWSSTQRRLAAAFHEPR